MAAIAQSGSFVGQKCCYLAQIHFLNPTYCNHDYCMVSYGIALHGMIFHGIAFISVWLIGFGARAVSRKTPIYFIFLDCRLIVQIVGAWVERAEVFGGFH